MRTLTRVLIPSVVLSLAPGVVGAQTVIGGTVGRVESRQLRDRVADTDTRSGLLVGAFVDVQTPVAPLWVLAEVFYAQRGGRYGPVLGEVQADVLGFTVAPTVRLGLGPVSVFGYGGPTVEMSVRTRSTESLSNLFGDAAGQILAVTAGGGVAVRVGVWSVRAEARRVEELSAAFTFQGTDLRHRSTEILVRVGRSGLR